jgi:hypothetical protein
LVLKETLGIPVFGVNQPRPAVQRAFTCDQSSSLGLVGPSPSYPQVMSKDKRDLSHDVIFSQLDPDR